MEKPGPVLVIGESLVDIVERPGHAHQEHPGGSAANAAVAMARLGVPVHLATAVGPDERGRGLRSYLESEGIRWASDPTSLERTSTAEALVATTGAARYTFDIEWRLAPFDEELPAPSVVLVSSLGPVLQPGAEHVLATVDRYAGTASVVYDVNARPAITGSGAEVVAAVERMAHRADLVKASDEDLDALWPGHSLVSTARRLVWLGAGAVVVTRGTDGATWVDHDRVLEVGAQGAEVVDTIGAGDTFGAALVVALMERGRLGHRAGRAPAGPSGAARPGDGLGEVPDDEVCDAMRWAARAAAVTVSRPGADPPRRADLDG